MRTAVAALAGADCYRIMLVQFVDGRWPCGKTKVPAIACAWAFAVADQVSHVFEFLKRGILVASPHSRNSLWQCLPSPVHKAVCSVLTLAVAPWYLT